MNEVAIASTAREILCAVVGVWLLDSARGYKLDRVALLARTLAYLGAARGAPTQQAVAFLLAQQHPTGCFGFFGPEVARARVKEPDFKESIELYLPTTLACLWALAECHATEFRLMASLR
jgi:hypothetical protein